MNEPRGYGGRFHRPPKQRASYRLRRPWWLPSRIGGNEIFLGALILPIFIVVKLVTDGSFGLGDALKLLGVAALLGMLSIGLHILSRATRRQMRRRR